MMMTLNWYSDFRFDLHGRKEVALLLKNEMSSMQY